MKSPVYITLLILDILSVFLVLGCVVVVGCISYLHYEVIIRYVLSSEVVTCHVDI